MNGHEETPMEVNGNLELDITNTITLDEPDLEKARNERLERTKATMKAFDSTVANQTFPKIDNLSNEDKAAIKIQCHYRGHRGRKLYTERLFEQFEKEEEMRRKKMMEQIEEGELLVENHNLEVQLDDNETTRKNKTRHFATDVITIQRAWRAYKRRQSQQELDVQTMPQGLSSDIEVINQHENMSTSTTAESFMSGSAREAWDEDMPLLATSVELNEGYDDDKDIDDSAQNNHALKPNNLLLPLVQKELNKMADSECESDYSEMADPVMDHFNQSRVKIIKKQDLDLCNSIAQLSPSPDETEEEFAKRLRKMNYLSLAQEFAELKKVNSDALPFDLHKGKDYSPSSESGSVSSSGPSAAATPCDTDKPITSGVIKVSNPPAVKQAWGDNSNKPTKSFNDNLIDFDSDCSNVAQKSAAQNHNELELSSAVKTVASKLESAKLENLDDFDVYNVETTLPKLDWDALEAQLQRATEEEQNRTTARKNDREEIRRKLAAGFDEEYYANERTVKKPNLQTRLQGGMNLQICFMNETSSDGELSETDGLSKSPRLGVNAKPARANPFQTESPVVVPAVEKVEEENLDSIPNDPQPNAEEYKSQPDTESVIEDEDFFARQARLQAEARLALSMARPMAKMQLEIEKQQKKKSSVAEQVIFTDGKRKKLSRPELSIMNLAQLQVLVNDIHTQIETLNEDLVKMLVMRDDLHMEQDSMLVDIEDLSRRAQELASRVNDHSKKSDKDKSNKKQKNRRKIFS